MVAGARLPWGASTCAGGASGGHLEVLRWAREHGCGANNDDTDDNNTYPPLLDLLERFPDLFAQKLLVHLDPIDRTFLAQAGSACRAAVAASDLPRAGTRVAVRIRAVNSSAACSCGRGGGDHLTARIVMAPTAEERLACAAALCACVHAPPCPASAGVARGSLLCCVQHFT